MLHEKCSLKLKVVKESDVLSERMVEHMTKIMKLEIKSAINVLIQINGQDQDMPLVQMELLYLYAMEEHMLEFISVDFRELTMIIKKMLWQQVTIKIQISPPKQMSN